MPADEIMPNRVGSSPRSRTFRGSVSDAGEGGGSCGTKWLLDEARYASISKMASSEKIEPGYLGSLLRLTLLAPDVVEAILDERQPAEMTLPGLMRPFPVEWPQHSNAQG